MTYCDGESTQEKFSSKWAVFAIAQLVIFFIMINFFQSAQFFQATQKSENGKTSNSILNFQVLNLQSSDSSSSNTKSSDKTSLDNEEIKTESKIYPVPKAENSTPFPSHVTKTRQNTRQSTSLLSTRFTHLETPGLPNKRTVSKML